MAYDPSRFAGQGAEDFTVLTRSALRSARQLRGRLSGHFGAHGSLDDPQTYQRWFDAAFATAVAHYAKRRWPGTASPVNRFQDYLTNVARLKDGNKRATTAKNEVRLMAWRQVRGRLFEVVVMLEMLNEGLRENHAGSVDLQRSCGPIALQAGGTAWEVWYQPAMIAARSGLKARPDICVTVDRRPPSESNVVYIVECKNIRNVDSHVVRSEFGKARDLRVASYALLSYYPVTEGVAAGAERLGLRIVQSALHGSQRSTYTEEHRLIGAEIVPELRSAVMANAMLAAVNNDSAEIERKLRLLLPGSASL